MLRTGCKALCALLALIMLLTCLAACGEPSEGGGADGGEGGIAGFFQSDKKKPKSHGTVRRTKAAKLMEKGVVRDNNIIVVRDYPEDAPEDVYYVYIDGLRDEAVEEKINRRLREVFDQMYNCTFLPPYRGVNVMLSDPDYSGVPNEVFINFQETCNSSNLFSGYAWASYTIYGIEDNFYLSYCVPFNFDLATGEELTLADIFYKDTDYISLLSDEVRKKLVDQKADDDTEGMFTEGELYTLTAPFKAISPEQKFYFENNGRLWFLIDYDTPEFHTDYFAKTMPIDLDDMTALSCVSTAATEKLYEDGNPSYRLIKSPNSVLSPLDNEDSLIKIPTDTMPNMIDAQCTLSINKALPEAVKKAAKELSQPENMPVTAEEAYRRAVANYGEGSNWQQTYYGTVNTEYAMQYAFVTQYLWIYISSVDELGDYVDEHQTYNTLCCFDKDGRELSLEDIFKRGCDVSALLKKTISTELQRIEPLAPYPEQADAIAERLVGHINGFALYEQFVGLSYDLTTDEQFAIVKEYMPEASKEESYLYTAACQELHYSTIGCENLTIFE